MIEASDIGKKALLFDAKLKQWSNWDLFIVDIVKKNTQYYAILRSKIGSTLCSPIEYVRAIDR
jgi:hypothetical protein